jgi:putative ABC transport system substrate-binding protein
MRRREFITLVGGAAATAWPLTVRAQQAAMPVIGYLSLASPGPFAHLVAAFSDGLKEIGYVGGQNVAIEYRWAEGQYERCQHFPPIGSPSGLRDRRDRGLVVGLVAKAATGRS